MAAYKAKKAAAAAKEEEAGGEAEGENGRESEMTVEFEAALDPNASTGIVTCQWTATPDMSC